MFPCTVLTQLLHYTYVDALYLGILYMTTAARLTHSDCLSPAGDAVTRAAAGCKALCNHVQWDQQALWWVSFCRAGPCCTDGIPLHREPATSSQACRSSHPCTSSRQPVTCCPSRCPFTPNRAQWRAIEYYHTIHAKWNSYPYVFAMACYVTSCFADRLGGRARWRLHLRLWLDLKAVPANLTLTLHHVLLSYAV